MLFRSRPVYGLNDAPRRWWNRLDNSLRSWGFEPTRADRCTYVLYEGAWMKPTKARTMRDSPESNQNRTRIRENSSSHHVIDTADHVCAYLGKEIPKTLKLTEYKWLPVINEDMLSFLDSISHKSGWTAFKQGQAMTSYRAKALRNPEPTFSIKDYPLRTSIVKRNDFWHIIEVNTDLRKGDKNVFLSEEIGRAHV